MRLTTTLTVTVLAFLTGCTTMRELPSFPENEKKQRRAYGFHLSDDNVVMPFRETSKDTLEQTFEINSNQDVIIEFTSKTNPIAVTLEKGIFSNSTVLYKGVGKELIYEFTTDDFDMYRIKVEVYVDSYPLKKFRMSTGVVVVTNCENKS